MRFLVTAGATQVDIDSVRHISNGFRGTTGEQIARYIKGQGHDVVLVTSNREFVNDDILKFRENILPRNVKFFRTYDELALIMEDEVRNGKHDVIIHSAAVSDYRVEHVLVWNTNRRASGLLFAKIDNANKISSSHNPLFLRMVPTEKLIDKIREPWGFKGKLVKFKLQVGITDDELIKIATKSMADSKADIIVANCLEWYKKRAYILFADDGSCINVSRGDLAPVLLRGLLE